MNRTRTLPGIAAVLILSTTALPAQVLVNQSGYNTAGSKRFTAPMAAGGTPFSIITEPGGTVVFNGTVSGGVGDFSAFEPAATGDFRVLLGTAPGQESSHVFGVGPFWIERVSYRRMVQFFIDSRSGFGDATAWNVAGGKYGSGIAWRDSHQFSFELRTLIQWYAANPDAFGTDRMPVEGTYNGLRDTLPADAPEIVRLIHWGVDIYLRGSLNHTLIKEELAYFLYYYPILRQWIPVALYHEARDYLFPLWSNTARDRWNWYDISHTANLFQTYTVMGTTKGSFPPGHSIVPNLLMHAVALREGRSDAADYLTAARNQTQWIVNNLDPANPLVTKGQRMSEHILVPALAEFMLRDPAGPVTGVDEWLAGWADTVIARSDNYWDFRKYSDTIWTPENVPGSHPWWNEPGNVAGFPASALSAATRLTDPAKIARLRAIAVSQNDQVFGRNPYNRHFSFRAAQAGYGFEGVESGWFSQHLGGLGVLENARGVLDSSAKHLAFPYNPTEPPGYVEGWVAFNSAWNAAMVWAARDRSSIEFVNRDAQGAVGGAGSVGIELVAPLNFNRSLAETATVRLSSAGGDAETLVLTETGPDTAVFRGAIPLAEGATPGAGDGILEAEIGTALTAAYAHDVFEQTATATAFESTSATWQWDGDAATSDWQTPANWDPDTAAAFFDGSFTATRLNVNGSQPLEYTAAEGTTNFSGNSNDATIYGRGLVIGSGARGSGAMNITGGTFSTAGSLMPDVVGNNDNNTGVLSITGAGNYISGAAGTSLGLGGGTGRVSTLTIDGTGNATITDLYLNSPGGTVTLDGGTLTVDRIHESGAAAIDSTVELNGGILQAGAGADPTFVGSLDHLDVAAGGAIIDSNGSDITVVPPLEEDPGSPGGGLTKNGAGLLTLGAPATITGDVVVNAGGLAIKSGGASSWTPATFSHSGDTLRFDLGAHDPANPAVISTGTLTIGSAVIVSVAASNLSIGRIPLIRYSSKNLTGGSLTLAPPSLPADMVATLVDNGAGLIYLNITGPAWSGIFTDTFDSGTGNWHQAVTGTSGTLTNDGAGRLRWSEGNGSNMGEAIGRSFDAQTLAVGDTIRLSFDFTWTSSGGDILRAGLFNVTQPIAADNWAGSNAIGAWQGYYTFVRDASASGNVARRDAGASTSGTTGPTNAGTSLATDTTNFNINDNATVTYQGMFEVTYVSPAQMSTLFTLKEGETTRFSVPGTTSVIYDTFDTVAFKTGANGPSTYFDNVKVEVLTAATGFDSWITRTFGNGTVPGGQQGPEDDPDHDGIASLLEFVLNGDPTVADPGILPTLDVSGPAFVFTYTRRDDSLSPQTTQTFQYGNNLADWTDVIVPAGAGTVGAATVTVAPGDPAHTVRISIPFSEDGGSGRLFGRLKVEQ